MVDDDVDLPHLSPEAEAGLSLPTEAASSEAPLLPTDGSEPEPHREETPALPSEREEEQPISSTITLLDKEEESDEERVKGGYHRQGIPNHCSAPPSFSSLCSCMASLQEYLHQRCSAPLSKKRKCQTLHQKQTLASIETPAWQRPLLPSEWHEAPQPHSEEQQPREREQAAEAEPEPRASSSEAAQPPEKAAASYKDSILELPLLEPSQTSNLPKHSITDSSSAKPAPGADTPPPSSGEAGKTPDVVAEERHLDPSACPGSSPHLQPSVGVWDQSSSGVSADHTFNPDPSHSDTNTPDETHHTPPPTPDPPVVHEADVSTEEPTLVPDPSSDPEPPAGHPVMADQTKSEDVSDDFLSAPSSTALPSSSSLPTSPSLSDIYADPPNGTEPNGNPVHGSSQKESVFMRLNNRIKALEMNMSLSGRYLEQLSQR